jgi:hypothetical protein
LQDTSYATLVCMKTHYVKGCSVKGLHSKARVLGGKWKARAYHAANRGAHAGLPLWNSQCLRAKRDNAVLLDSAATRYPFRMTKFRGESLHPILQTPMNVAFHQLNKQ